MQLFIKVTLKNGCITSFVILAGRDQFWGALILHKFFVDRASLFTRNYSVHIYNEYINGAIHYRYFTIRPFYCVCNYKKLQIFRFTLRLVSFELN